MVQHNIRLDPAGGTWERDDYDLVPEGTITCQECYGGSGCDYCPACEGRGYIEDDYPWNPFADPDRDHDEGIPEIVTDEWLGGL